MSSLQLWLHLFSFKHRNNEFCAFDSNWVGPNIKCDFVFIYTYLEDYMFLMLKKRKDCSFQSEHKVDSQTQSSIIL